MEIKNLLFANVTKPCVQHLEHLMKQHTEFALQSYNFADDIDARLHRLKDVWPASFQQCLDVRSTIPAATGGTRIQGQYCLAYLFDPPGDNMNHEQVAFLNGKRFNARHPVALPQTGLCVPDSCSSSDTQEIVRFFLREAASNYTITIPPEHCQTDKPRPVTLFTKLIVVGLILLVILAITGTIIEISDRLKKAKDTAQRITQNGAQALKDKESVGRSAITCFSLFSNSWYLFKMDMTIPGNVEAFNGARFLATIGCQVVHVVLLGNWNGWRNIDEASLIHSVSYRGFFHLPVLLQVAVTMSGASIMLSAFHRIHEKDKQFFIIPFYLRRLYRLSVPYFISIALVIGIVPHISYGPRWVDVLYTAEMCKAHWWTNVLYINNYVHVDQLCQVHSWYLSTDIQLLLIAPVIILSFKRSSRLGFAVVCAFITFSVSKLAYHAYADGLNTLDLNNNPTLWKMERFFFDLYFVPYSRLGCYSLGMAMGYFLYTRRSALHLSLGVQRLISFTFALVFWSPFFFWYRYEQKSPSLIEATIVEALGRISWSASVGVLCLALQYNFQDFYTRGFKWFLYRRIFVLTSKLHYSVYLIHITIIQVYFASRPEPLEFTPLQFVKVVFGLLAVTHVLAIPYTLLAELPFFRLERLFEERRKAKKLQESLAKQK